MRVKPTFRILCVNWLVRASRAKTKLPHLHIQFRKHRVLIVPQTVERGLILVLSWVVLTRIDICFRVVLTRIDIHAHVGAHTARERSLMTRTRDTRLGSRCRCASARPRTGPRSTRVQPSVGQSVRGVDGIGYVDAAVSSSHAKPEQAD
eukprot:scaffold832_cov122-Amphora_coffeaeformis.AAC.1